MAWKKIGRLRGKEIDGMIDGVSPTVFVEEMLKKAQARGQEILLTMKVKI